MSMNTGDINHYAREVEQGRMKTSAAMAQLVAGGMDQDSAWMNLFTSLGGGDIRVVEEDGTMCYQDSGRPVDEVRRLMEE